MQTNDYKLIDQFLRGELDEVAEQNLQERMQSDEEFAEEVRFQEEAKQFIQHREDRNQLKEQLFQLRQEAKKEAKVIPFRRKLIYYLSAAAAIALICIFIWPFLFSNASLYDQYAQHEPLALQKRNENASIVEEAENAFNKKDYATAYTKLKAITTDDATNIQARLAYGISALETDRLEEAKQIFQEIAQGQSAVKDSANWYLALTFLKEKNEKQAAEILQLIPENTFWGKKAQELLTRIQ